MDARGAVVVAACWAVAMTMALAWLAKSGQANPSMRTNDALQEIEAWARAVAQPGVGATVIRMARGCHCTPRAPSWSEMSARWQRAGARTVDAPAIPRPAGLDGVDLLLVDTNGRLAFVGPLDAGPACGPRHPIDLLLASASRDDARLPPIVLDRACACP